ncbi:MAG: FHA domain-containing protein [Gammaproteobacteria bacterium]|nr:MAG: FHA domain-containing protein [Gammaproteobacteria bacterium]
MPWLVPRSREHVRRELKGRTVIGRNDDADLRLDRSNVSRIHCVLQQLRDGTWALHDPGSRNAWGSSSSGNSRRCGKPSASASASTAARWWRGSSAARWHRITPWSATW